MTRTVIDGGTSQAQDEHCIRTPSPASSFLTRKVALPTTDEVQDEPIAQMVKPILLLSKAEISTTADESSTSYYLRLQHNRVA